MLDRVGIGDVCRSLHNVNHNAADSDSEYCGQEGDPGRDRKYIHGHDVLVVIGTRCSRENTHKRRQREQQRRTRECYSRQAPEYLYLHSLRRAAAVSSAQSIHHPCILRRALTAGKQVNDAYYSLHWR